MLVGIGTIIIDSFLILRDEIILLLKTGDVKSKMIAGSFVKTEHFERRSRTAALQETMDADAVTIRVATEDTAESLRVTVEIRDDRLISRKKLVEFRLLKFTIGGTDGAIGESGDIDKTEFLRGEILLEEANGRDSLTRDDVANACKNVIRILVRDEVKNSSASVMELRISDM